MSLERLKVLVPRILCGVRRAQLGTRRQPLFNLKLKPPSLSRSLWILILLILGARMRGWRVHVIHLLALLELPTLFRPLEKQKEWIQSGSGIEGSKSSVFRVVVGGPGSA
ncbi:hypothetical protein B0H14DRAFT_3134793 [Mycena olivaceomarginata]|nr:hypothetical protein B0H14DRAFT_3134793 [Mycena olivaceomarginata]